MEPVYVILVVVGLFMLAVAGYACYVNTLLAERKKSSGKPSRKKPRKKDRTFWSIGD